METISASINEWKTYNDSHPEEPAPLHFRLTGNSMYPLLRHRKDEVVVMPCRRKLKVGDIVLVRAKNYCGDYILHRIIRIKDGRILTMGDGNLMPDLWVKRDKIYGVAVYARRGNWEMDFEGLGMRAYGRIWMLLRPIRKVLLHMIRGIGDKRLSHAQSRDSL